MAVDVLEAILGRVNNQMKKNPRIQRWEELSGTMTMKLSQCGINQELWMGELNSCEQQRYSSSLFMATSVRTVHE